MCARRSVRSCPVARELGTVACWIPRRKWVWVGPATPPFAAMRSIKPTKQTHQANQSKTNTNTNTTHNPTKQTKPNQPNHPSLQKTNESHHTHTKTPKHTNQTTKQPNNRCLSPREVGSRCDFSTHFVCESKSWRVDCKNV